MKNDAVIVIGQLEIYSVLEAYQFLPRGRLYKTSGVTLIDVLSGRELKVEALKVTAASVNPPNLEEGHLDVSVARKCTNRKEVHELQGRSGRLRLGGRDYEIESIYMRSTLGKKVPERTRLYA